MAWRLVHPPFYAEAYSQPPQRRSLSDSCPPRLRRLLPGGITHLEAQLWFTQPFSDIYGNMMSQLTEQL
jgi:hypothetical protein